MANPLTNPPAQAAAADPRVVTGASIDVYLTGKGSPIAGSGADIVAVGQEFDLDPRFLVAIAGAETGFGNNVTAGKNNVCNVLYHGHNSPFVSYRSAFHSAGKSIRNPANGYDLTTTTTFYSTYCYGDCSAGLDNLNKFMQEQGGNTSALRFPKAPAGR